MTDQSDLSPQGQSVPVEGVVPIEHMAGDDDADTALLRSMSVEAERYLRSFSWCGDITSSFFGGGLGGIFAVFLFNIRPTRKVPSWIWVVVGDIPPAYLPLEDCKSTAEVFRAYIRGMGRWVAAVREGRDAAAEDDIPPVNVPPTLESAEELGRRLDLLLLVVKPFVDDSDESKFVN